MKYLWPLPVTMVVGLCVLVSPFSKVTFAFNSNKPWSMYLCVATFLLLPSLIKKLLSRSQANRRFCPMAIPFCARSFARLPTDILPLLAETASANNALGLISSICLSLAARTLCASISALAINSEPLNSFTWYCPVFLNAGNTSDVTHLLNFLALGNLLERTKLYSPDSLIIGVFRFLPIESRIAIVSLSSPSTCLLNASF